MFSREFKHFQDKWTLIVYLFVQGTKPFNFFWYFQHIFCRLSYNILFAIGGWSAGNPTNFVETYDIRADKWLISYDKDSEQRAYHGVCVLDGIIYIIGGFDGKEYFNSAKRFYPITHTWNSCACMNFPRCYVSVTCLDHKIYAIGGFNGRLRMNSVERYNPIINQWEIITPMRKPRSDAGAATLLDKVHICSIKHQSKCFAF